MNTKQAIKKVIDCADYTVTKHAIIMEWLEDINWHAEHSLYWESLPVALRNEIDRMHEMIRDKKHEGPEVPHYDRTKEIAQDYIRTMRYLPGATLLTGWGLDDSFNHSTGLPLVEELQAMTN